MMLFSRLGANTGMAAHVMPFLKALAWRTRVEAMAEVSVDEAYALAAQIRGSPVNIAWSSFIQGLVNASDFKQGGQQPAAVQQSADRGVLLCPGAAGPAGLAGCR